MKQWDLNWELFRNSIIFADSYDVFFREIETLIRYADSLTMIGRQGYAVDLVKEILIDLKSSLARWLPVSEDEKEKGKSLLEVFLKENGAENSLEEAEREIASIKASQLAKIADLTQKGQLATYWSTDLCTDVDFSIRRGAVFSTSNPSKINLFRNAEPAKYQAYLEEAKTEFPEADSRKLLSVITAKVVAQSARKMRPIYEKTNASYGVSLMQVSPENWDNAAAMAEEVRFWIRYMQKELEMEKPNIVFKLPCTPAAKEAGKELLKDSDVRLAYTCCFAAGQQNELFELVADREPFCFLVLVDCHLRKYVMEDLAAQGIKENLAYYGEKAAWAVFQKCYDSLLAVNAKAQILSAGMREDVGIRLCLTDRQELPFTMTVTPQLASVFDSEQRDLTPIRDEPVDETVLEVLRKSKTFLESYEEGSFPWEDINSYEPFTFMMSGFFEAYYKCLHELEKESC